MARYCLKFAKTGLATYTSHLDMMRFFKRAFHRAEVPLAYSQGFNPHPKMSFAQPLSLGYEGKGEYMEFFTTAPLDREALLGRLNAAMPEGLSVLACVELPEGGKSLAALCESADYRICVHHQEGVLPRPEDIDLTGFLAQEQILVERRTKKGRRSRGAKDKATVLVDIRPQIHACRSDIINDTYIMYINMDTGSESNLSPQLFLKALEGYLAIVFPPETVDISREALFIRALSERG